MKPPDAPHPGPLKRMSQFLFFGGPSKWYLGPEATQETRAAVIEWLNDRAKLHTWITSVATGTIVFLAALAHLSR